MFDLHGKNALVTGASGAIGASIARFLHGQGAHVTLSGRRQEVLDQLKSELGDNCETLVCDLGNPGDVSSLIEKATELMGSVDILVNNAGLTKDGLMMRMKDDDWQDVLNVNLGAVFKLSRAAIKGMMKSRWGRIINITSVVGVSGNPGQANYAASKAGMIGMAKSLAQEVGTRGITVNCIAPGFITSPMTDVLNDDQKAGIMNKIPVKKIGNPQDIASAAGFLASQEANYITGQTLHVNGGMVMV
ncbi:MAG: 3-oxoacyl-[acyl-carrier-protein] reductase [Pseudomonadota bacterium]